ncbi:MAG: HPF/RaiA family ribosome-associated protein [Acidobacteriota bacterium]|nr:HPF/RaiA family ribosome-associated protein [Acidobacteriota bacterium]
MKTTFTARHVRLHPRLREIVETKLAKLARTLPHDAEAHVVVTAGKKDLEVEVSVSGRHGTLTAAARAGDQTSAAQEVMDRIAAQAVKSKTKATGVKKRAASPVRNPGSWPTEPATEVARRAGPRRESQAPRAMFEEDALTAFASSRREILVFRDPASHHALRFLYRRKDGTIGLVAPE